MAELPEDSSTSQAGKEASTKRKKGGKIVKSRYMQCFTTRTQKDSPATSFSTSTAKPSSAAKPRSVPSQKCKTLSGNTCSSLKQRSFEKGNLQSTLLDDDHMNRPELDLSAINDQTVCRKATSSKSTAKEDSRNDQTSKEGDNSDDVIEHLESLTLLLTYLRVKGEKNLAKLEEKAEQNLIMLCKEKMRLQEKNYKLKREILLKEREQKLEEALDKQLEVLTPLVAVCEQFKEQYKCFATALDATRHELPIKNIHIEGDMYTYLDELGKELTITQELLTELMPSCSDESAKTCSALKELKEVSQELDKEIQRSVTQMQNLASEVNKEVSLHNQQICEENCGLDVAKCWYFD